MASRLILQSTWDEKTVFVHRPKIFGKVPSLKLNYYSVFRLIVFEKRPCAMIFHAQSSLPYLIFSLLINKFFLCPREFIYDIHDLNELDEKSFTFYLKTRFYILDFLERLVCNSPNVRLMTVSEGLKKIISKKNPVKSVYVVRSIAIPSVLGPFTDQKSSDDAEVVFFGTGDRAPVKMLKYLKEKGIKLDVYGRNMPPAITENVDNNFQTIRYLGEYRPNEMAFLKKYKYLLLVSDKKNDNYRFSLPNKLFQALSYGLTPILTSTFEEAINLFKDVPGSIIVLNDNADLMDQIYWHKMKYKPAERYNNVIKKIQLLYHESKWIYQSNTTQSCRPKRATFDH